MTVSVRDLYYILQEYLHDEKITFDSKVYTYDFYDEYHQIIVDIVADEEKDLILTVR